MKMFAFKCVLCSFMQCILNVCVTFLLYEKTLLDSFFHLHYSIDYSIEYYLREIRQFLSVFIM
jgi:hypothetical protein